MLHIQTKPLYILLLLFSGRSLKFLDIIVVQMIIVVLDLLYCIRLSLKNIHIIPKIGCKGRFKDFLEQFEHTLIWTYHEFYELIIFPAGHIKKIPVEIP